MPRRLLAGFLILAAVAHAEVSLHSGFDYSSGDYGQSLSTQIITVPVAVAYTVNRTTWELGWSYVRIDGPGDVVPGVGRFSRRARLSKTVQQGLGDLTLGVAHAFAVPEGRRWSWTVAAELKFGTADADKFLGTGKDDFAMRTEWSYEAGAFTPFATLGYRWLGNPAGSDLRDHAFGTVGISWACSELTTLGLFADWAAKNAADGETSSSFTLSVSRALGAKWTGQLYGMLGNSDATADYSLGVGVSRRF